MNQATKVMRLAHEAKVMKVTEVTKVIEVIKVKIVTKVITATKSAETEQCVANIQMLKCI